MRLRKRQRCTPMLFLIVILLGSWTLPRSAQAAKYMTLPEAVKVFIPSGATIVKVTKTLSTEQKERLKNDYSWVPKEEKYVFYMGKDAQAQPLAFVFVVQESINTCFHEYAVGMKPTGEVVDTVVTQLSCPKSFPINRKTFLSQFRGQRHTAALTIKSDVDAVTGATMSSEQTAQATRKAVSLHNLLFGVAEPSGATASVRAARESGNALIEKAIASGETLEKKNRN